jgi:hypothetical protein
MTMGNNKAASKMKAKESYDSEDEDGDGENKGHEMTPVHKRMNVRVKSSYGPIQDMPTVQEHQDKDGDVENKEQEQGHEMTPVRKHMDVQVKSSYGPIQEMPPVWDRNLEISIDDAIGTFRCVPYVNSNRVIRGLLHA